MLIAQSNSYPVSSINSFNTEACAPSSMKLTRAYSLLDITVIINFYSSLQNAFTQTMHKLHLKRITHLFIIRLQRFSITSPQRHQQSSKPYLETLPLHLRHYYQHQYKNLPLNPQQSFQPYTKHMKADRPKLDVNTESDE
ncbi:hypothetical protein M758_3G075700 [Ceratodon purpureus]|nr:hypothetical protein M758_3G075700 [Ceratodon purpureus]